MSKVHALNDSKAVFLAEIAVNAHGQGAAVTVTKPTADGRNIDAGLNAGRGENVAKKWWKSWWVKWEKDDLAQTF